MMECTKIETCCMLKNERIRQSTDPLFMSLQIAVAVDKTLRNGQKEHLIFL